MCFGLKLAYADRWFPTTARKFLYPEGRRLYARKIKYTYEELEKLQYQILYKP